MANNAESSTGIPTPEALAPVMADLRRDDRDRYLTALLAPPEAREGLMAVYGFNLEIARVRETVSEELIGRMRLQWWRDRLDDIYAGTPPKHPVAEPLAWAVARFAVPRTVLEDLIAAREDDLAAAPPADLAALEDHARRTAAPVVSLALRVLDQDHGPAAAAAADAALAQALTGTLRAVPFHLRAGVVRLPGDLCRAAGLDLDRLRDRGPSGQEAALSAVISRIADRAGEALTAARRHRVPRRALPALLPARLAARDLKRLERAGFDPFAGTMLRVDGLRPLVLLMARLGGNY
jgi:NADH dehydrogenase [ubiquinone] 1 alpha subcomplex assembly factor 6